MVAVLRVSYGKEPFGTLFSAYTIPKRIVSVCLEYHEAGSCRDANGNAVPGAISSTLAALGRVEQQVDNSAGGAGDQTVRIATGVFQYDNSAASGAVTLAQVGKDCYIVDDHSVTAANAANNKSVAGTVFDVDASGVWVKFN